MRRRLPAIALLALAAKVDAAAPAELSEVIVTARRIPESSSFVPLAIDAIAADRLGAGGVRNMSNLAETVPGLSFESMWGGTGAAPVIRGQSQPSTAGDNVGVFVDEIYQAGRSQIDLEMLDFERIEVVRGPQNTLFGRSTFAGAIEYVSQPATIERTGYLQVELGSDSLAGLQGAWSGRLSDSPWLGRLALSHRTMNGTQTSTQGEDLGGSRRDAATLTLSRRSADETHDLVTLNMRLNRGEFGHPATTTLNAEDFNCGGRDATSGIWSYFCGRAPAGNQFSLSSHLPDSNGRAEQVSLRIEQPIGGLILRLLTGYYHARSTAYRDFDGSASGFLSGVCTTGVNCGPGAPSAILTRFTSPNVVSKSYVDTTDWSQELRLGNEADNGVSWMAGIAASWTRELGSGSFGADRENLGANERLSALDISNPNRVGQISRLNSALVTDSRIQQVLQTQTLEERSALAAFGMLDVPLSERSHLRMELRSSRETQQLDSRYANYVPNTEPDPPQINFTVLTPRVSLDLRPAANWYAYASVARGARAGGANTTPGLVEEEKQYDPEYNWTTELGIRHQTGAFIDSWQVTIYRIDWQDTQILGVSTSPGVNALITGNTAGLTTLGVEAQIHLRFGNRVRGSIAYSHADPRFNQGSDDAGSRPFCGLTAKPPSSNFCNYGPPRTASNGTIPLVPYLDDNLAARTPRDSWSMTLQTLPITIRGAWQLSADATFSYQDNVYERPIDGASYGARELLSARVVLQRGQWRAELWGRNLADYSYIRAAASRGQAFYPSLPRPLDLLYGEGQRVGLTVSLDLAAD
ncbi:MAG: TonB-dependent receptor [Pseudomonadota bacterium]